MHCKECGRYISKDELVYVSDEGFEEDAPQYCFNCGAELDVSDDGFRLTIREEEENK